MDDSLIQRLEELAITLGAMEDEICGNGWTESERNIGRMIRLNRELREQLIYIRNANKVSQKG